MIVVIIFLSVLCIYFVFLSIDHYNLYERTYDELLKLNNEHVELKEKYSVLLEHEQVYKTLTQKI